MFTITAERTGRLKIPTAMTNVKINVNSGRNVYPNCRKGWEVENT